jgi:hypothetical protein
VEFSVTGTTKCGTPYFLIGGFLENIKMLVCMQV